MEPSRRAADRGPGDRPGAGSGPGEPAVPPLADAEVHVWLASLDDPPARPEALAALLSADEQTRVARYRFLRDRDRAIARRGLLRLVLAGYVGAPPRALRFGQGPRGKPHLGPPEAGALRFNLSDSHGLMLLAVTRDRELGVDLERVEPSRTAWDVAERFFAPAEVEALRAVPAALRAEAFFRCWTRKEAYIKARGDGLALPLDQFQVSLAPGAPAALLWSGLGPVEASRWRLADLPPIAGHAAALCVEAGGWRVRCWRWANPEDAREVAPAWETVAGPGGDGERERDPRAGRRVGAATR